MGGFTEPIDEFAIERMVRSSVSVETRGPGFLDITGAASGFLRAAGASEGLLTVFVRHTSASLAIQENADPDVLGDLATALDRLAPRDHPWRHRAEGPDDMPAHVRAMLTGASLAVPVRGGRLGLGNWQGLYLVEHRDRPHRRRVDFVFVGR
ncbi:secondary thiamine-phosphate synthase enzyme YjbQ [Faunimonas sp. B44]|uniref:secondary thiamine-phosphate synthase enzyme YjbQ n=1 Tax=Faunimonas sp. B44 TaxID=3461493 RepID=UPI004043EBD4